MRNAIERGDPRKFASGYTLVAYWRSWVSWTASSWANPYGSATPLTQATGALQPTSVASQLHNLPAIRFDGAGDYMQTAFTLAQPCTTVLLYKSVTVGLLAAHDIIYDGASALAALVVASDIANAAINYGSSVNTTSGAMAADTIERWCVVANGASSTATRNGASVMAANIGSNSPGGITLGAFRDGSRSTNIDVFELAIFAKALPADVQRRIDARLRAL